MYILILTKLIKYFILFYKLSQTVGTFHKLYKHHPNLSAKIQIHNLRWLRYEQRSYSKYTKLVLGQSITLRLRDPSVMSTTKSCDECVWDTKISYLFKTSHRD